MARSLLLLTLLAGSLGAQTPNVIESQVGADGARLGWSVSDAGDVDGDGTMDYVAGEPRDDTVANSAGRARVFSGATGAVIHTVFGDAQSDQLGYAVCGAGELTGDNRDEFVAGAPFDDDNGTASGLVRVYRGSNATVLYEWLGDNLQDEFGRSVAHAGDVDNDSVSDIIVGAPETLHGGFGYARIFSGATGNVIRTLPGVESQSAFGISVAGLGDVNDDGFDDVVVGAYQDDTPGISRGRAYIYSGIDGSLIRFHDGLNDFDWFGWSVGGAGDVDGDDCPDVIVGAYGADPGGDTSGQARVFSGMDGSLLLTIDGAAENENLGWSVDGAGDVDGDGLADLIVGAPVAGAGLARVVSGFDGSVIHEISGDDSGDQRGRAVAGVGADLNGDGYPDVLVGAPLDDDNGSSSGTLLLVSGYQPWSDLGCALAGVGGDPLLVGAGPLVAGSSGDLSLTNAAPSALAKLFVSLSSTPTPFKGGTLKPVPWLLEVDIATAGDGSSVLPFVWPVGFPASTSVYFQFAIKDGPAPSDVALSNAVLAVTP